MQNIFAPGGLWATPWMERVLPGIVRLVEHDPARTIFTRFITPTAAEERPGQWRRYFMRWSRATQAEMQPSALELVAALAKFVPPATVIDKPAYSAFFNSGLSGFLTRKEVRALILTGSETDVCVLSSVLDAVDYGFRVIVVETASAALPMKGTMRS
jgi:nicotinamidase-related amidase